MPYDGILIRREEIQKLTQPGSTHVMTEAEIQVRQLQAKEHQGLLAITRSQEEARKDSFLETSKRTWPC